MTSVADDQIQSLYRRWLALEEQKKEVSDDLKELFAEARGSGFDGKALRAAFKRVLTADDAATAEHEAIVDLYVGALTRVAREEAA